MEIFAEPTPQDNSLTMYVVRVITATLALLYEVEG